MSRITRRLVAILSAVGATLALAASGQAVLVQYTSTLEAGLGDGLTLNSAGTTLVGEPGVNGLPACNQGLTNHNNAIQPGAGFVEVGTGPAPQSLMFGAVPFYYGTPAPTVGGINSTGAPLGARPGVPGINGGPVYTQSTCSVTFNNNFFGTSIVNRTHMSNAVGPFKPTTPAQVPGSKDLTIAANAGFGGPAATPFVFAAPEGTAFNQVITVTAGPNKFGGGLRQTGGGRIDLGAFTAGGGQITGFWLTGPRIIGHGVTATPTQMVTNSNLFAFNGIPNVVPVVLRVTNFPFTTGTARQFDSGGNYISNRTSMGTDARNAAGTSGSLVLVSPWNGNLVNLGLWFGGTAKYTLNLMPEPSSTALLACGVLVVVGLHVARRRR